MKFSPPLGDKTINAPLITKTELLISEVEVLCASVTRTKQLTEETFGRFQINEPAFV